MKSRNHGVIVNIIGAAGERFNYDYITGSAGNAALMAFTKSLGGKGCAMTFASLELIPSRLKPTRLLYLMKTRSRTSWAMKTATAN
jgi:hypothetical protein